MKYAIACVFNGGLEKYHKSLANEIAKEFGLTVVKKQNLPTHLTLKYPFNLKNIKKLEEKIEKFAYGNRKAKIKVGGFGFFGKDVAYLKINNSFNAGRLISKLIKELKTIKNLDWTNVDAENLVPHCTLVIGCNKKFKSIKRFLQNKEKYFNVYMDNLTIFKLVSKKRKIHKWKIYKKFSL